MAISIKEFRVSFLWNRTLLSEMTDSKSGPFSGRAEYEALVGLLHRTSPAKGFELPWLRDKPFAHRFWVYYLGEVNPALLLPGDAWAQAVPFRATTPPATVDLAFSLAQSAHAEDVDSSRARVEGFVYPFGIGLIVSFTILGNLTADAWVDLALILRSGKHSVTYYDGKKDERTLVALADDSLSKLTDQHFDASCQSSGLRDPFTIMTVVQGSGVAADVAPADGEEVHRHVQGAATQVPNWRTAGLDKLEKGVLDIRSSASPGDLVYAVKRGRTIWSPSAFSAAMGPMNALGCYHRNQVIGALQTDALCGFALAMGERIQKDPNQPPHLDELATNAATILPKLYVGEDTYRSKSLQKQIDDAGVLDLLKRLVKRYGLAWPQNAPQPAGTTP